MSRPAHVIDIDRLVLTDLDVTPERAERIRALVEVELQRLLVRDGVADGLNEDDVPYLQTPALPLARHNSDQELAGGLAQRVAQALNVGR
jgi:hypothetical protein